MARGTSCSDWAPDFWAVTTTSSIGVPAARLALELGVVSCAHVVVAASTTTPSADPLIRLIFAPSSLQRCSLHRLCNRLRTICNVPGITSRSGSARDTGALDFAYQAGERTTREAKFLRSRT